MATIVTTLSDRRRVKRWKLERKVLRKLSLEQLKKDVEETYRSIIPFYFLSYPFLIDPCMNMAIDAYLVGAEYGRFGYLGESEQEAYARCEEEVAEITFSMFNLLQGWLMEEDYLLDSLYKATEDFVEYWWQKGFKEGEKQYRMRLH